MADSWAETCFMHSFFNKLSKLHCIKFVSAIKKTYQDVLHILNKCSYCSVRFTCFSGSDSDGFFMGIKAIKFIASENSLRSTYSTSMKVSFLCWNNLKCMHIFWCSCLQSCDFSQPKYSAYLHRHRKSHANIPHLCPLYTGGNVENCSFNRNWSYLALYRELECIFEEVFFTVFTVFMILAAGRHRLGCIFNELYNFGSDSFSYRISSYCSNSTIPLRLLTYS